MFGNDSLFIHCLTTGHQPFSPILFLFMDEMAAGGIVVFPSGRRTGVTLTSSQSIGTWKIVVVKCDQNL